MTSYDVVRVCSIRVRKLFGVYVRLRYGLCVSFMLVACGLWYLGLFRYVLSCLL